MDALTQAIGSQLSQCLLCYAAAYAGLSTSSWADQLDCFERVSHAEHLCELRIISS